MKHSRFRHVFSKSVRRSEWYDTGPGHGLAAAVNPKMIALAVDVPAGGIVQVAKLCSMGKGHMEMGKIKDHEGAVCDLKWNPFNDNVLATGSNDTTVRIWHIDDMLRIRCLRVFRKHTRRVHTLEWHCTVDNVILSASLDGQVILWNIETDDVVFTIENSKRDHLFIFSRNCSEFAATTRSRELIVFDSRTGKRRRSAELAHDGSMLPRVAYIGTDVNSEHIITTGNSRNTRRQIAMYNSRELGVPIAVVDVDSAAGLLLPVVDNDLNLLFIAGKGDASIRFYEVTDNPPYLSYLNDSSGHKPYTAVCAMPKRGLNVKECEIMKLFLVDAEHLVMKPLSFIVPRRDGCFQSDLFPPTRSPTPSLTFREWFAGLDSEPILLELRDCILNCTNKPVTFSKLDDRRSPKLITADANNDRKFRFLSQPTRPDYREVSHREDREHILKLEEIRAKLAADRSFGKLCKDESGDDIGSDFSADENIKPPSIHINEEAKLSRHKNESLTDGDSAPSDIYEFASAKNGTPEKRSLNSLKKMNEKLENHSPVPSVESGIAFQAPSYNNKTLLHSKSSATTNSYENGSKTNGGSVGALSTYSEEAFMSMIKEMDKELRKCRERCGQLEHVVQLQQQDIESLRFEISWKDKRIEYLQTQLSELDMAHSISSRSN
uniref:Coronin n=1 Tax=Syphacia muris TaxID=451379 RepID=A0A0N5A9P4_9BILA